MTSPDYYELGRADFHHWNDSRHYAWMSRDARAIDVMRLFWPPVPEDNMQIQRPLPKSRREWLQGFEDARAEE